MSPPTPYFSSAMRQIGDRPLILLDGNGPHETNVLLSTADLNFGWEVGPRITVGHDFDAFHAVEASYFGIYNFQAKGSRTGTNDLNLPGDLGAAANLDFTDADAMSVTYDAVVNNGEINYLRSYGELSCLMGFRYFELGEKFNISSTDLQTGTSFYDLNAYNNLFGFQGGLRLNHPCSADWSYDLTGKAGVYYNSIHSSQEVGDFSGFVLRSEKNQGNQAAFLGEVDFNVNYQFTPVWSLRGGYQVFWVDGVALAPNQLDFTDTPTSGTHLDKTGSLFMQGAHAGLMARW